MQIVVKNNIEIKNPIQEVINYCNDKLVVVNPKYSIAQKLGYNVRWMEKEIKLFIRNGDTYILPFGCLTDIWEINPIKEDYKIQISEFKGNKLVGSVNLYDYQQNALNKLLGGKNGVLQAPCGSGKTQIGLAFIQAVGGKALWLTHTKDLLKQSMERAKGIFTSADYGTITEGKVNIGRDITFATVQTMRELDPSVYANTFDIVVVDECHHCVAGDIIKLKQFHKVLSNINCRYKIGLSATLTRSDGMIKTLYSILGRKLHTIKESEVGSKIIKATHTTCYNEKEYKISDYSDTDGMLNYAKLINLLSEDEERNQLVVDNIKRLLNEGRKQLVLCSRISQVESLYEQVKKTIGENNKASVIKVTSKIKNRNGMKDADIIIATFQLAKEGLDVVKLDAVHFVTPQKEKSIVKQSAGRVERNYEGKRTPIIVDYIDKNIPYCLFAYNKRKNFLK